MDRKDVFDVITNERLYSERIHKDTLLNDCVTPFTVEEEVRLAEYYLDKAKVNLALKKGDLAVLHELRTIAAGLLRCFEHHGVPLREFDLSQKSEETDSIAYPKHG